MKFERDKMDSELQIKVASTKKASSETDKDGRVKKTRKVQ